ncbi:hypothetical protein PIB30_014034 [Stylosanthes scabra]|uniref:Disease resistance R13L4/SHOC-2-like LRR domain-containing protein n=1 Tax=Stylosanthes scabra TaxID=79078 RepID=A0ABU6Z629_9FABA|nr:hypothetical protein [Stylosanthes scabra]
MSALKELHLGGCKSLRKLPEFGECMKHLSILSLRETAIEIVPMTVGCLVGLSNLDLSHCIKLHCLPSSIGCLVGLKELNLEGCNGFTCLPDSIQELKSLTDLNLSYCPNLSQSLHFLSNLTSLVTLKLAACFDTSQEESSSYNLGHLLSLTNLDLSRNKFERVPINIHELSGLRYLTLDHCYDLKVFPELPSSIRELNARNCVSLDVWNAYSNDIISKACCDFVASASHEPDELLQMCLTVNKEMFTMSTWKEIPLWFVHQQQGIGVLVTLPQIETKTMALALCFRVCPTMKEPALQYEYSPSVFCNGKEFIKKSLTAEMTEFNHTHYFILCFTTDCFADKFCQDYQFLMVFPEILQIQGQSAGALWLCIIDYGVTLLGCKSTLSASIKVLPLSCSHSVVSLSLPLFELFVLSLCLDASQPLCLALLLLSIGSSCHYISLFVVVRVEIELLFGDIC